MEIPQFVGFIVLALSFGGLAWGLWLLFCLRREEKWLLSPWEEEEKLPKLPRDPLERAFRIGELLHHLQRETMLMGSDENGRRMELTLQTTPWGIRVIAPAGVTELMYSEADKFVEDMKLLLKGKKELVKVSKPFEGPLKFRDYSPSGGLIFEQGGFRAELIYGFYWLESFLRHYRKVRRLLRELQKIKDAAEELVGALRAMEELGVG